MATTLTQPKVGIVSLGCPKALVDSERIITRLRAEGYQIADDYKGADLVLVNTCGFLDSARAESLDAIGEAINENGKVIVTGCLGAEANVITERHPGVLAVTGPHQYEQVMTAVHTHLPAPDHPFVSLVPESGVRLTPRHYAYLKISEGCNNRCSFCIIPSLRGDLASRRIDAVLRSSFIVGFPGETEEDFEHLLGWMKETRIERAGCFKYENVTGATSAALPGHVPEEVKEERWHRFMQVQSEIADTRAQAMVGQTIEVIIDEIDEDGAVGRSKADAPEIDGSVFIADAAGLKQGDVVKAKVHAGEQVDLWAEVVR